jgi:hypothetical protein
MMNNLLAVILATALFATPLMAETTLYEASRLITADMDTTNVTGSAIVEDSGPFTPMTWLGFDLLALPCDDGRSVQASPAPAPCDPLTFAAEVQRWTQGGMRYVFDDGTDLSIVRRGSVATGDPSLIIMDTDGRVMLFREKN